MFFHVQNWFPHQGRKGGIVAEREGEGGGQRKDVGSAEKEVGGPGDMATPTFIAQLGSQGRYKTVHRSGNLGKNGSCEQTDG